jgi:hypothetical protein
VPLNKHGMTSMQLDDVLHKALTTSCRWGKVADQTDRIEGALKLGESSLMYDNELKYRNIRMCGFATRNSQGIRHSRIPQAVAMVGSPIPAPPVVQEATYRKHDIRRSKGKSELRRQTFDATKYREVYVVCEK